MRWMFVLGLGAILSPAVHGADTIDHQRVGTEVSVDHRWELAATVDLLPWSTSAWELSVASQVAYEWRNTWGVDFALPYRWQAREGLPTAIGQWGGASAGLHWSAPGEPRWRLGVSWSGTPWGQPGPPYGTVSGSAGWSAIRDPIVWGISGVWTPFPFGSGSATFSFQEVVNDAWVWSLALSPRWTRETRPGAPSRIPAWSVVVVWGVAWYEAPWSLSTAAASGSGDPWSLSATGSLAW